MTDVYCQLIPSYVNRESTYILASYPPATARNAHLCRDVNVNSALWIRFIHPVSVLLVFEIYEALSEKKKCVVGTVMTTLSSLIEEDKDVFDKLEYTPSNPLKEATEYIVHIEYVMDESESGNDKHIISFTYRFFTVNYKFPRIVDTFPYHLTENVSIVQPVYIKFDHPVLINNFVCNVDVYPPHQFSVHPDSSNPAVIILVPILPLLPNTVYFIKIGKWVYDYYFKRMLDSVFFSFKTGDYFIDLRYLSMDDGIDLNGIRNLISHSHEQSSSNSLFFKYLTRKGCLNLGLKHDFKYIGIKKEDSFEDSIISLEHTDEFKSKSYYPLLIYSSPCVDDRILSILRSPVSPKQSSFSFQFGLPQFSFSALFSIRHRYLLSYYGFMVVDDEKNNKINLKARQKKKSSLLLLLARPPAETLASYLRHHPNISYLELLKICYGITCGMCHLHGYTREEVGNDSSTDGNNPHHRNARPQMNAVPIPHGMLHRSECIYLTPETHCPVLSLYGLSSITVILERIGRGMDSQELGKEGGLEEGLKQKTNAGEDMLKLPKIPSSHTKIENKSAQILTGSKTSALKKEESDSPLRVVNIPTTLVSSAFAYYYPEKEEEEDKEEEGSAYGLYNIPHNIMDDKGRTQSSSNENSNNDVRNGEVKYGNLPQLPKMVYIPELHKSVDLKNISSPKMDVVRLDAGSFSSGQRKSISGSSLKENMSIRKVSASPDQFLSPYLSSIYLLPTPWNMSKTSLPTSIYSLLYDDVVAFALLILEIVTGRKPRNYWSYTGSDGQSTSDSPYSYISFTLSSSHPTSKTTSPSSSSSNTSPPVPTSKLSKPAQKIMALTAPTKPSSLKIVQSVDSLGFVGSPSIFPATLPKVGQDSSSSSSLSSSNLPSSPVVMNNINNVSSSLYRFSLTDYISANHPLVTPSFYSFSFDKSSSSALPASNDIRPGTMAADRFTTPFPQAVLNSDVSFLHHLYTEEIERIPFPFIRWIVGVCLGFNWGTDEERGLGRSFGTESGGGGGGGYDSSIRSSYMSKAFGSLFDSDSTVGQTLKSTVFESGPNKLKKNKVVPSFLLLNELFRLELLNMMSVEGVSFDKQNKTILPQLNEKENVNNNNAGDDKTFTFTRYIEKKKMLEQKKLEEEKRRKEEEEENFGWDYGDPSESGNLITTQDINRQALLKPVFKKSEHDVKKFKLKLVEFDLLEKKLKQFVNKNNLYTSEDQEFYQERMKWIVKSSSTDEVTLSPLPFQPLNDSTSTASLPSVFSSASIPIQSNMRAMRSITGVIGRTLPQKRKPQLFSSSFLLHNRMGKRSGFSRRDDIEREYEMMENSEVKTRPINVESLPMHLGREWLPPLSFIQDPPPPPDLLQMVSEMKKKFRQEEEEGEERVNKRKEEEKKKNEEEEKKMAEIDNLLNSLSGVNNNTSRPTSLSAPGRQGERRTSMFSRPNMDSKRKFITPGYETQMYGSDHAGVARFSPVPKRFLDLNKKLTSKFPTIAPPISMSVSSLTVPVERFLHSQTQQTQKRYSNISLFTSPVPLIPSLQHTAINCMSLPTLDELSMEYTDTHFLLPSNIIDSVYVRSRYGINPRSTTEFNDPPISPINISVSRYLLHAVNILNGYTNGMITKDGLEYHFANEDLVSEDENVLIPATIKRKKKTKKHLTKNIISLLLSITEDDRSTDPRFFESIETPKTSSFPLQVSSFLLGNQLVNRIESAEFRNAFLKNIV